MINNHFNLDFKKSPLLMLEKYSTINVSIIIIYDMLLIFVFNKSNHCWKYQAKKKKDIVCNLTISNIIFHI